MTAAIDVCNIYIYKGDVGSWTPSGTGGFLPSDAELISEDLQIQPRDGVINKTFPIPEEYQSEATAFTIFVWIFNLADNQNP